MFSTVVCIKTKMKFHENDEFLGDGEKTLLITCIFLPHLFSLPEHKVLKVSCPMSSVCHPSYVNNFFKHPLLNHWANHDKTWQGCSLGEDLQKMIKEFNSMPWQLKEKVLQNLKKSSPLKQDGIGP